MGSLAHLSAPRTKSPLIGGILSSTLLTLLVLPALYRLVHGFRVARQG